MNAYVLTDYLLNASKTKYVSFHPAQKKWQTLYRYI